jgi:hypothetical protein
MTISYWGLVQSAESTVAIFTGSFQLLVESFGTDARRIHAVYALEELDVGGVAKVKLMDRTLLANRLWRLTKCFSLKVQ